MAPYTTLSVVLSVVLAVCFLAPCIAQNTVSYEGTVGGTSGGSSCVFPFTYEGRSYNACITTKNKGFPWCSITAVYQGRWANCKITCDARQTRYGNSPRSFCVFPFIYRGKIYEKCTTDDYVSNKPWCATSDNYDRDRKWAECVRYPDVTTTDGVQCVFPFVYRGVRWHGCITLDNKGRGWCSTTSDYGRDKQWGNCRFELLDEDNNNNNNNNNNRCRQGTNRYQFVGNQTLSYGAIEQPPSVNTNLRCQDECNFTPDCLGYDWDYFQVLCFLQFNAETFSQKVRNTPGVEQWERFNPCRVDRTNNPPGPVERRIQCKGGDPGQSRFCVLPYRYRGTTYTQCTSRHWYTPWCGTTQDYDRDKKWCECVNIKTK